MASVKSFWSAALEEDDHEESFPPCEAYEGEIKRDSIFF